MIRQFHLILLTIWEHLIVCPQCERSYSLQSQDIYIVNSMIDAEVQTGHQVVKQISWQTCQFVREEFYEVRNKLDILLANAGDLENVDIQQQG